ncbi:MAG: hypothetical protein CMF62_02070 [Magnetococcales bacterium]|nr:hypothetical protein [Magnetococcales bacterium]|tara:strand:+ start:151235 stop:151768 length:534 start_codon:yes stop_codon:yes gene_type:complete
MNENYAISKLQKTFRLKQYRKAKENVKDTLLDILQKTVNYYNNKKENEKISDRILPYLKFSDIVLKKENIDNVSYFLKKFYHMTSFFRWTKKLDGIILLNCYLIVAFPNFYISEKIVNDYKINKKLFYKESKELLALLHYILIDENPYSNLLLSKFDDLSLFFTSELYFLFNSNKIK